MYEQFQHSTVQRWKNSGVAGRVGLNRSGRGHLPRDAGELNRFHLQTIGQGRRGGHNDSIALMLDRGGVIRGSLFGGIRAADGGKDCDKQKWERSEQSRHTLSLAFRSDRAGSIRPDQHEWRVKPLARYPTGVGYVKLFRTMLRGPCLTFLSYVIIKRRARVG